MKKKLITIGLITFGLHLLYPKTSSLMRKELSITRSYQLCMNTPYQSEDTKTKISEFLIKYQYETFGLYFEELNNEYTIVKNPTQTYYGASLVKLVVALYLLDETNEIDLNLPLLYLNAFQKSYSLGMSKYRTGSNVAIKELINYLITVSDNTAHEILLNYIGIDRLRQYASASNINLTISNVDHYGYLTPYDCNEILKSAYKQINKKNDILKSLMNNYFYNALNFNDITFLHKYGYYNQTYNDIGIFVGDSPYLISILTNYGYQDYTTLVQNISKEIYEIYQNNLKQKEKMCQITNKKLHYKNIVEHSANFLQG